MFTHATHFFANKKISGQFDLTFPIMERRKIIKGKKETSLAQLNPPRKVGRIRKTKREREGKGGQPASTLTLSCWQSFILDMT